MTIPLPSQQAITTLFFPGLGADSTLAKYHCLKEEECLWIEWPQSISPDWDEFLDSLSEQIPSAGRFRFVGISFGGLVAMKMAERLKPVGGVFLVGSLIDRSELRPLFRLLLPWVRWIPTLAFDLRFVPKFVIRHFFGIREPHHLEDFLVMASRLPGRSVKSLCSLLGSWSSIQALAVRRIHGREDRIIQSDSSKATLVQGGHLISMTHSDEVNAWLESSIFCSLTPPKQPH